MNSDDIIEEGLSALDSAVAIGNDEPLPDWIFGERFKPLLVFVRQRRAEHGWDDDGRRMPMTNARTHLAWLMWCYAEGYGNAEDRAIMTNWLLDDPATLSPGDAAVRRDLLDMADEILAQAREDQR